MCWESEPCALSVASVHRCVHTKGPMHRNGISNAGCSESCRSWATSLQFVNGRILHSCPVLAESEAVRADNLMCTPVVDVKTIACCRMLISIIANISGCGRLWIPKENARRRRWS